MNVQHSHGVACPGYDALPYRTGYEEVIGAKVDDLFVVQAEDDGKVIGVKPDSLTVEYGSGDSPRKISYPLGIRHGTVSGTTIPHTRITDLKIGDTFHKGSALVFNSGFFKRSEMNPENVVYKAGVISRVVLMENTDTIEDSCVISQTLADKLVTPATTLHGVIVDFDMILHNLVKIGDVVEPDTILCTVENYINDDLESKDASAIRALNTITKNVIKAKVYGKVTNIEVLYFGKLETMHPSLQAIANEYDARRSKQVKQFDLDDAKTGQIDESIRVANKKVVANQMAIKIYIDGTISMGTGDKLVIGNMLKTTCGRVAIDPILSEDGQPIDVITGYQSISDRIVGSPELTGLAIAVMMELSKQMGRRYQTSVQQ